MNKITKETCIVFIKDYYKGKIISASIFSLFVTAVSWYVTKNITVVAILGLSLLALCITVGSRSAVCIKNVESLNFYLAEDVVIKFKKRRISSKSAGSGFNYTYTFKEYGKQTIFKSIYPTIEIPLHKEKGISHTMVDDHAVNSCNQGDEFYLLISEEKNKKRIIKCFYKYYYDIKKDDFVYKNSKYYCNYAD